MGLFWLLILGLLVFAVMKGGRNGSSPGGPPAEKTALDILKERYARGEIGKQEFEEKRRNIES